jgi:hypothetical protein
MGIINAENLLSFRSTTELFNRIKKRLESFDSQNLIDEGDFYDYVVEILEKLGVAVYRECEWVGHVKDHKVKLPCNFRFWYAGYKVHPEYGNVPSINEQRPWIWYQDSEITQECKPGCTIECNKEDHGRVKVVVRTFVNGDEGVFNHHAPTLLILSPNVKDRQAPHAERMIPTHANEVTIDDEKILHTRFKEDSIYLQYYGLPMDENMLPMIPDNTMIEKSIEYYIYKMLFETWYFNSTVPGIANQLKYVSDKYDHEYWPQALYFVKLPSFQRCLQSIRLMRSKGKWMNPNFDRTRVGGHHRGYTGFPIV